MVTDIESVVIVVLFVLFCGVMAYNIRPLDRRKSRRPVALSAATDSPDPPFVERRSGGDRSSLRRWLGRRQLLGNLLHLQ